MHVLVNKRKINTRITIFHTGVKKELKPLYKSNGLRTPPIHNWFYDEIL